MACQGPDVRSSAENFQSQCTIPVEPARCRWVLRVLGVGLIVQLEEPLVDAELEAFSIIGIRAKHPVS